MPNTIQPAFSAGELSPRMYARVDLSKYHTGAAFLSNFIVDYRGGASNRNGTLCIGPTYNQAVTPVRLIPYVVDVNNSFILEVGIGYIRFLKNSQYVAPFADTVTAITQATPGVISFTGSISDNEMIMMFGIAGPTQLNARWFFTQQVGPNQFYLIEPGVGPVETATVPAWTGGGQVFRALLIVTPYGAFDLPSLKYDQNGDVGPLGNAMTITHFHYGPHVLQNLGSDVSWAFFQQLGTPGIATPTGVVATQVPAGSPAGHAYYAVTAIGFDGSESLSSFGTVVADCDVNFQVSIVNLTWDAVPGARYYNVFAQKAPTTLPNPGAGVFGYIGSAFTPAFQDTGIVPDTSTTPVITNFDPLANGPSCCCYYQQRHVFAGAKPTPQTLDMSRTKDYFNFNASQPLRPDDAISVSLVSSQVNIIQFMVSMPNGLIVLTEFGAWQVSGGSVLNQPVTPENIVASAQSYVGISPYVLPLVINYDILYVAARGNTVRDLVYNFYTNIYSGTDISMLASHLFEDFVVTDWCYSDVPNKLVWAVRNDGKMLTMAFVKEQEIQGWSQQSTTNGRFLSCASIVEGQFNAVYVAVARRVNGVEIQYIERFRQEEHWWYFDSAKVGILPGQDAPSNQVRNMAQLAGSTGVAALARVQGTTDMVVYTDIIVDLNGNMTLPAVCEYALVGYPVIADLATLRLDLGGSQETQQGKRKNITSMTVRFYKTTGAKIGSEPDDLQDWNPNALNTSGFYETILPGISVFTGDLYMNMRGGWTVEGQMWIRQDKPYPVTVLGVIPEVVLGDTAGGR